MSDDLLGMFNIEQEITRFQPTEATAGRRAETLMKSDGLRVVLITMQAGASLTEHAAPGPITIQAVHGRFAVTFDDKMRELGSGDLIALASDARHAVTALADGAFLLTIGRRPSAHPELACT